MMKLSRLLLSLSLATGVVACGKAATKPTTSTSVKQKVGAAGGSVTLGTGVSLKIPAGALTADIEIGVEEVTGDVAGFTLGSKRYRFTPEGTTFASPVTVSLEQTTVADGQSIYWSKAGGAEGYDQVTTTACGTSTSGKALFCGDTTHFSEAFIAKAIETGPSGPSCGAGETACGEACFNLQTSAAHCGACATACEGEQICGAGTCQPPIRTVTLTVKAPSDVVRAASDVITFVGHKIDGTWHDLTATTGAGSDLRTYTFTTQEATYEIAVGCTLPGDPVPYYSTKTALKDTVATPTLTIECGKVGTTPETPDTLDLYPTLVGIDVGSYGWRTTVGSGDCTNNPGRAVSIACTVDKVVRSTFDMIYGTGNEFGIQQGKILRDIEPEPSGPSMSIELPVDQLQESIEANLVINIGDRLQTDFDTPVGNLFFATAKGEMSNNVHEGIPFDLVGSELTFQSHLLPGTVTGDVHTFRTQLFQFGETVSNTTFSLSTTVQGAVTSAITRNVTLPQAWLTEQDDTTGALTGVPRAGTTRAVAYLEGDTSSWELEIDAEAQTTGANYALAPQALTGLTGYSSAFDLQSAETKNFELDVTFLTQDTTITANQISGK